MWKIYPKITVYWDYNCIRICSYLGVDTHITDILKRGTEVKDKEEQKVTEVEKEVVEQKDEEKDKQDNN